MHASHKLNVVSSDRPIRQRVRHSHSDRHQIIKAEVDNLLKVGFIKEFKYPEWLANVVVVPKKGGKWRICVDYTDLNDACPKDSFPLPRIDQIIDASAGHGVKVRVACRKEGGSFLLFKVRLRVIHKKRKTVKWES